MYVSDGGLLRLITSSGCMQWSNARADRTSDLFTALAEERIRTKVEGSPCGRWVLVMDGPEEGNACIGHIAAVEALTGHTLVKYHIFRSVGLQFRDELKGMWSMSGDICLLEQLDLVLVCYPQAPPTTKAFQLLSAPEQGFSQTPGAAVQARLPKTEPLALWQALSLALTTIATLVSSMGRFLRAQPLSRKQLHIQSPCSQLSVQIQRPCSQPSALVFMEGRQTSNVLQEAWHPLHRACVYAMSCSQGRVHLIDAKANRCVRS